MSTRFYQAPNLNIDRMARDFGSIFYAQGYQVQHFGNPGHMVVQLRKGGDFEALLGMQAALTVILRSAPGGVVALIGEHRWEDKAASGLLGMLFFWPLIFTTGAGVLRQAGLEGQLFEALDTVAFQQRSDLQVGAVPPHLEAQMQQQDHMQYPPYSAGPGPQVTHVPPQSAPAPQADRAPVAPAALSPCGHCQKMNDADDLFCSWCGSPLKTQKVTCAQCKAALKPGADFCAKCGASASK